MSVPPLLLLFVTGGGQSLLPEHVTVAVMATGPDIVEPFVATTISKRDVTVVVRNPPVSQRAWPLAPAWG